MQSRGRTNDGAAQGARGDVLDVVARGFVARELLGRASAFQHCLGALGAAFDRRLASRAARDPASERLTGPTLDQSTKADRFCRGVQQTGRHASGDRAHGVALLELHALGCRILGPPGVGDTGFLCHVEAGTGQRRAAQAPANRRPRHVLGHALGHHLGDLALYALLDRATRQQAASCAGHGADARCRGSDRRAGDASDRRLDSLAAEVADRVAGPVDDAVAFLTLDRAKERGLALLGRYLGFMDAAVALECAIAQPGGADCASHRSAGAVGQRLGFRQCALEALHQIVGESLGLGRWRRDGSGCGVVVPWAIGSGGRRRVIFVPRILLHLDFLPGGLVVWITAGETIPVFHRPNGRPSGRRLRALAAAGQLRLAGAQTRADLVAGRIPWHGALQ